MKNATFYLLDNDTTVNGLAPLRQHGTAERWRAGEARADRPAKMKQAIRLDEALWARPAEVLSHNLAGERPTRRRAG